MPAPTFIREFEVHPAAALFPELDGQEFDDLVASVREYGVREPIVFYGGALLDGRNRMRAAVVAGIPSERIAKIHLPREQDPYRAVWDLNGVRRHLTPMQRAAKLIEIQAASGEWQRALEEAREEANRKRAEKMTDIPYASKGNHRKPQAEEGCGSGEPQPSSPPRERESRTAKKLASQAGVSVSTAKRALKRKTAEMEETPTPPGRLEAAKERRIKLARRAPGTMWRVPRAVRSLAAVLCERLTSKERKELASLLTDGLA